MNNLTGKIYGHLKVMSTIKERASNGELQWRCKCECGSYTNVRASKLVSGRTSSCGKCVSNKRKPFKIVMSWPRKRTENFSLRDMWTVIQNICGNVKRAIVGRLNTILFSKGVGVQVVEILKKEE